MTSIHMGFEQNEIHWFKMADGLCFSCNDKWRLHYFTATFLIVFKKIIKVLANFMIVRDTFMATFRGKIDEIWVLPIK